MKIYKDKELTDELTGYSLGLPIIKIGAFSGVKEDIQSFYVSDITAATKVGIFAEGVDASLICKGREYKGTVSNYNGDRDERNKALSSIVEAGDFLVFITKQDQYKIAKVANVEKDYNLITYDRSFYLPNRGDYLAVLCPLENGDKIDVKRVVGLKDTGKSHTVKLAFIWEGEW